LGRKLERHHVDSCRGEQLKPETYTWAGRIDPGHAARMTDDLGSAKSDPNRRASNILICAYVPNPVTEHRGLPRPISLLILVQLVGNYFDLYCVLWLFAALFCWGSKLTASESESSAVIHHRAKMLVDHQAPSRPPKPHL
jgi:hypothetical protein